VRAERERDQADRVLAPVAGVVVREVVDVHGGLGMLRAVPRAHGEDRGRGRRAERGAVRLGLAVGDQREVVRERRVEARALRREQRDERVVRSLRDRGLAGLVARTGVEAHVALVAAVDREQRLEHRDVHDRHRARRATRPELLAEDVRRALVRRHVVDPARIDRDRVPAQDLLERRGLRHRGGRAASTATARRTALQKTGARGGDGRDLQAGAVRLRRAAPGTDRGSPLNEHADLLNRWSSRSPRSLRSAYLCASDLCLRHPNRRSGAGERPFFERREILRAAPRSVNGAINPARASA
jgi:hypothetical protein